MKSDLRRFLEDEFQALAEPVSAVLERAGRFREGLSEPGFAVWAWAPPLDAVPQPPPGSALEQHLYTQLLITIKPLLALAERGFDTVPMVLNGEAGHAGPPVGDHFQAAAMGAQIRFPDGLPPEQRGGATAWVDPILADISELAAFDAIDVAASPTLRAFVDMYEQTHEIVRGAVPNRLGFPDYGPLDFAGDVVGHEYLYELIGADLPNARRLLNACYEKGMEIRRHVEAAVGGEWIPSKLWYGVPGIARGDMIARFISPDAVRQLILPLHAKASKAYGGISVSVGHPDSSLLEDVVQIPGLCGVRLPPTWPIAQVVAALRGKVVLTTSADNARAVAGKLRVIATIAPQGQTWQQRWDSLLRQRDALDRVWAEAG